MTAAQGRPCLQGLEWSSICGPEAGSVPTVPWQENDQPSQPRQLGYSQGAMENWRASVPCWSRGSLQEEGWGLMSQEQGVLYYFGTARTWHLPCSVSKTKPRLVTRASCLCWPVVIKFIIWQVSLEKLPEIWTIFTYPDGVSIHRHCNTSHLWQWIFKNLVWNDLEIRFKQNMNYVLLFLFVFYFTHMYVCTMTLAQQWALDFNRSQALK